MQDACICMLHTYIRSSMLVGSEICTDVLKIQGRDHLTCSKETNLDFGI